MDRQTDIHWTDGATNTLRRFEMDYDNADMIERIDRDDNSYRVYTYNSLNRLTKEEHFNSTDTLLHSATYEYDLAAAEGVSPRINN